MFSLQDPPDVIKGLDGSANYGEIIRNRSERSTEFCSITPTNAEFVHWRGIRIKKSDRVAF